MGTQRILATLAATLVASAVLAEEPSPGPASATDDSAQARMQDDTSVAAAVHEKLAAENNKALEELKVSADGNGTVWLSGRVYSQDAADRAVALAKSTDGVRTVKSKITVAPESRTRG